MKTIVFFSISSHTNCVAQSIFDTKHFILSRSKLIDNEPTYNKHKVAAETIYSVQKAHMTLVTFITFISLSDLCSLDRAQYSINSLTLEYIYSKNCKCILHKSKAEI